MNKTQLNGPQKQVLRNACDLTGVPKAGIARLAHVEETWLSNLLTGNMTHPNRDHLERLCFMLAIALESNRGRTHKNARLELIQSLRNNLKVPIGFNSKESLTPGPTEYGLDSSDLKTKEEYFNNLLKLIAPELQQSIISAKNKPHKITDYSPLMYLVALADMVIRTSKHDEKTSISVCKFFINSVCEHYNTQNQFDGLTLFFTNLPDEKTKFKFIEKLSLSLIDVPQTAEFITSILGEYKTLNYETGRQFALSLTLAEFEDAHTQPWLSLITIGLEEFKDNSRKYEISRLKLITINPKLDKEFLDTQR